jgi:oxygen-independent coproporphyrinogen-3 oxidase
LKAGALDQELEILSDHDRFNERVMVGLRTKWGADLAELRSLCIPDSDWYGRVDHYKASGKLVEENGALILTTQGRLLADGIASDLFLLED